jgi:hypothetical protein
VHRLLDRLCGLLILPAGSQWRLEVRRDCRLELLQYVRVDERLRRVKRL